MLDDGIIGVQARFSDGSLWMAWVTTLLDDGIPLAEDGQWCPYPLTGLHAVG